MCGISGIVVKNSREYKSVLENMTLSISHRGPDGDGFHFFKDCSLGHRRLSIVDLSTGDQPMITNNGNTGIVFNGEIYGYKEIKKTIANYNFKTTSDTEVILALYEKYGEKMTTHLPGIFSFAIWDDQEGKLFCARDRFGEKPFYYAIGKNGEFIFASEIKAILASGLINPILDPQSVSCYLKHLYIYPSQTIYRNIHVLPASHQLIFKDGKIKIDRYWHFPVVDDAMNIDDALPVFKKLLSRAVERQLIADVPVGAFLSGGLDSSTVVALASMHNPDIKTFSFAFRDSIDETPFAKEIAKKYKTDHIELFDDQEDLGELLIKMQEIYDEPFGDSSNIPTYLISKLARQHIKVVLTGDGGDEIMGGYDWYKPFLYMDGKNDKFWRSELIYFMARAIRRLTSNRFLLERALGVRLKENFSSPVDAHLSGQDIVLGNEELKKIGFGYVNERTLYRPSWKETRDLNDIFRADLENYITGDILVKTDRASMANGLELRAPFLDIDLASFCISLPYQLKINRESDKIILRKSLAGLWTPSIRRRSKQGFGAPLDKWLSDKSLVALKQDYLMNRKRKIFEIVSFDATQLFIVRNNYKTWALLVLSLWMERHNFDM